jgi:phospholipase C
VRKTALLLASPWLLLACSSSSSTATPADTGVADSAPDAIADTAPIDPLAAKRAACTFGLGAKVAETLGFAAADRAKVPISHVIVVMKENRSFDHYFGKLPAEGRTDVEGIPSGYTNPDPAGAAVAPSHETNACFPYDPDHQWAAMHAGWNDGKMDGFVKSAVGHTVDKDDKTPVTTDGHFVLTYRERTDLPFYFWLTDQYAMADHYHSSALAGTWANRLYLYAANSYGVKDTAVDFIKPDVKTIFDALDTASVTYGIYSDDVYPLDGALLTGGFGHDHKGVAVEAAFFTALADGTLPQVSFIDAGLNKIDEHPPADVQVGEAWTKKVYDAVTKSPLWLKNGKGIALVFTYDESGGFADHVPPPSACLAAADQAQFDRLGVRVPFVMISPFAKKKYVSHKTYDHTSVTRFIEMLWDLPAMSARDANADGLLDFFDFTATPNATPPTPPAAGMGVCNDTGGH